MRGSGSYRAKMGNPGATTRDRSRSPRPPTRSYLAITTFGREERDRVMDTVTVKQRQQAAWASGDYAAVGTRLLLTAELLCEAADLRAGEQVLDVACGNGNASLAAARRFCQVVGVDYVPALLERARRRADAEGLDVTFQDGDAEALPFPDASFDAVLSTRGAMFAPDQERTAAELLRVAGPAGGSAWSTGPRTATSGSCSGPSAGRCRRPGCARRRSRATRVGCASCSARPSGSPHRGGSSCGGSRPPRTRPSSSPPSTAPSPGPSPPWTSRAPPS